MASFYAPMSALLLLHHHWSLSSALIGGGILHASIAVGNAV